MIFARRLFTLAFLILLIGELGFLIRLAVIALASGYYEVFWVWISTIMLVSITGLIVLLSKTILHALAFWLSNFMPIIFLIMADVLNPEYSLFIFTEKKEFLVTIIVFSILQFLYGLCIGTLWQKGCWRFQRKPEYGFDINAESRGLFSMYQRELILCQFTVVFVLTNIMTNLDILSLLDFKIFKLLYLTPPLIFLFIIGIQQESQCIVCTAQCFVVIFGAIIGLDLFYSIPHLEFLGFYIAYGILLDCICETLLISLFIQTIQCQCNFRKGLKLILNYEPRPKEFTYDGDEELLDKKNDEKLPENFWDKKDFSIRKECLAYWNVFWKAL